jgi:two-component system response regulator NreC
VLIADDHHILRAGLSLLINGQTDMVVVGEASDGAQAIACAKETAPDVVIMDLAMASLGGIEAIPGVRQAHPPARVLVLTMHDEVAYLRAALAAGAAGYVVKTAADSELLVAIRAVAKGRRFLDLSFDPVAAVERPGARRGRPGDGPAGSQELLSERESDVLTLLAHGHTNREAAEQLGLSVKSVESYRARLMEKLGVTTRAELVRFALDSGALSSDKPPKKP